jgi:mono/diheme cytochrome c family protein
MTTKRILKIAGIVISAVVLVMLGAVVYITTFLPKSTLKDIKVEMTPERMQHGKYLVNHVVGCIDCHSTRNWLYFTGPVIPGTEGKGGEVYGKELGLPGRFVAPNITPFALKKWTDAEIFRAVAQGINKEGKPLFPLMPYQHYGTMDIEDIYDVIAYIRSLPEIASTPEESKASFPVNILLHLIPQEPVFTKRPDPSDSVAYGKYLVNAATCIDCHTVSNGGKLDMSKAYAGGMKFPIPQGFVVSANITPSVATGIGNWTEEIFVARFKAYESGKIVLPLAENVGYNTFMPWTLYGGMNEGDLASIYKYLRTLKPIENKVEKVIRN